MNPIYKLFFLTKEIGIPQLTEYALYKLAERTGIVERNTPSLGLPIENEKLFDLKSVPFPVFKIKKNNLTGFNIDTKSIVTHADSITKGNFHPFSGEPQPFAFTQTLKPLEHWTRYGDLVDGKDIKWIWEPARFAWSFILARAYLITGDEQYPKTFWDKFAEFEQFNPVNLGPNWLSAQEVAIRIITWVNVYQIFKTSKHTTEINSKKLAISVWHHAARIPPTLAYARSQKNNHQLSEALGLIVAGSIFSNGSQKAKKWLELGINEFNSGLLNQIEPDGTYSQHSANYHRLMLQISLIYYGYTKSLHVEIPTKVIERLAAATRWMIAQLDPVSGRLPNLGHNDGTLLLPMGTSEFRDYRPTAQAASRAFLGAACLPPGPWDELSVWLGLDLDDSQVSGHSVTSPAVHKIGTKNCWATLRGVKYHGRPAHADQLHLDLWWNGTNITQDAGTFSYNEAPPWDNSLSSTLVHNTIMVDEQDQMVRAGKFLWLEQALALWLPVPKTNTLCASHNGYRRKGISHQRTVDFISEQEILVTDLLEMKHSNENHQVVLHWLLPDWSWKLNGQTILLEHKKHWVGLSILAIDVKNGYTIIPTDFSVIRAGSTLLGSRTNPILGWVSHTYGVKEPALSFLANYSTTTSIQLTTCWKLTTSAPATEE